jgi:catalase
VRERVLSNLANVDGELASMVATGLGIEVPEPAPLVIQPEPPEVEESPALSLLARPGDGGIRGRKVAILVAAGVDGAGALAIHEALAAQGAVPRLVGPRLGAVHSVNGDPLEPDATLETMPSCLFDAVVVPDGQMATEALCEMGHAVEFVRDAYRHCKAILAIGAAQELLAEAGVMPDEDDAALLVVEPGEAARATRSFIAAMGRHRNWDRAMDPPVV